MPSVSDERLSGLAAAANEAARREAPQWIAFLSLMVYLAISVGTTTHRALLDEKPMRLPILNIDVPLVTFFWVAPLILVIIHFYVQAQLANVTVKVARYVEAARARAEEEAATTRRHAARLLEELLEPLDGFAGAQYAPCAAVSRRIELARLMTTVTITVAPPLMIAFFLLKFLPYQSEPVTWLHRLLLLVTLVSSLYFRAVHATPTAEMPGFLAALPRRFVTADRGLPRRLALLAAVVAFFSAATIRGEAIDWPRNPLRLHWMLYDGQIAERTTRPPGFLFSRVLVLPDETLIAATPAEIASDQVSRTAVLRDRALRGAVLSATDLRKADLTRADLRGARLDGAWLDQSFLFEARLDGAHATGARFQGAWLSGARLTAAVLDDAAFHGAQLGGAQLHGASLRRAWLQASALEDIKAVGADFSGARLQAAFLLKAELQGARFTGADLRGADLRFSRLAHAEFADANLDRASLPGAEADAPPPAAAARGALADVPVGLARRAAVERLAVLGPRAEPPRRPLAHVLAEAGEVAETVDVAAYLNDLACRRDDFPFVLRGVLHQIWDDEPATRRALGSPARDLLARSLLNPRACAVAAEVPSDSRARLETIIAGRDRPDWRPAAAPQ